jgi:hypothetical protein
MPRKRAAVVEAEEAVVAEADEPGFDEEACRQRAYEISQSEDAGTPEENWIRAEQELRGAAPATEE